MHTTGPVRLALLLSAILILYGAMASAQTFVVAPHEPADRLVAPEVVAGITAFSNLTGFNGLFHHDNGGAALIGANTITKMTADDFMPAPGFAGRDIFEFSVVVNNSGSIDVTARVQIHLYNSNGPGGLPGTRLGVFPSQPILFPDDLALVLTLTKTEPIFTLPGGKFWAGISFDDSNGTIDVTPQELNHLGMTFFNPPDAGASADQIFKTNNAGASPINAPAGAAYYFLGNPIANFGWEFLVPEPSSIFAATVGAALLLSRRRRHSGHR